MRRVEERARALVERHEETIATVATALLERLTITGDELREIVAAYPPNARHSRSASSFPRSRAQRSTHSGPSSSVRKRS